MSNRALRVTCSKATKCTEKKAAGFVELNHKIEQRQKASYGVIETIGGTDAITIQRIDAGIVRL